tara:strand:- start:512 stop:988 length:477 start_codon:yes stop_codon:yes gene_type:complete
MGNKKKIDYEEIERQNQMIVDIGRAMLLEPLSQELQEVVPGTNEIVLSQEECVPFGYSDPLIPSETSTSGTRTPHGIREQEEVFCLHCASIFPASQLKRDQFGNLAGCGSKSDPECDGAGFGVDLHNPASDFSLGTMHGWDTSPQEARRKGYIGHNNG